jgi:hypothetical protein
MVVVPRGATALEAQLVAPEWEALLEVRLDEDALHARMRSQPASA